MSYSGFTYVQICLVMPRCTSKVHQLKHDCSLSPPPYQVGAHGTGATLPPVDDQIVSMKIATPALGTITLSQKDEPELFSLAKVGLGALGVVTQVRGSKGWAPHEISLD